MKPTPKEIQVAVRKLSAIPFFPAGEFARESIMDELAAFVLHARALDWLVRSAMAAMTQWQGCAELRALHNTRFKPADGIEGGSCSIRGFTPEDNEARAMLTTSTTRYLPAPDDTKISDEERRQLEALAEKVRLR